MKSTPSIIEMLPYYVLFTFFIISHSPTITLFIYRTLLKDEARIHFSLKHENVVKMHGLIFEGSNSGLILEFMEKGDLVEFIRKHKPGYEIKLKLLSDVASGMKFLHQHTPPIIHGDLKATNILISQDIRAKVLIVVKPCELFVTFMGGTGFHTTFRISDS